MATVIDLGLAGVDILPRGRVDENGELLQSEQAGYCPLCGKFSEAYEPDICLGYLPGVNYACCGHGEPRDAYVCIGEYGKDRLILRGHYAIDFFRDAWGL